MKQVVALILLVLVVGAVAWWVLEDRPEAESPYADRMLEGQKQAQVQKVVGDFRAMHFALENYQLQDGTYPEGNLGAALGPYMAVVPSRDPWGTYFRYTRRSESRYELRSAGADRTFDTPDDVVYDTGSLELR